MAPEMSLKQGAIYFVEDMDLEDKDAGMFCLPMLKT